MNPVEKHTSASKSDRCVTEPDHDSENRYRNRMLTIPNIICFGRLVGALSLFFLAVANRLQLFVGVFVVLSLSDWIDGRLARWLKQRSDFGARLDSFADSVLYGALLFGMLWLRWDVLGPEAAWWIVGVFSYALTTFAGLWKYRRVPSYHTYGAKFSQWLVLIGAVCLLLDYSVWPFRLAMLAGTLANLEATAITWYLAEWHADVLSIVHAKTMRDPHRSREAAK
ncbi:MAG: CDP-alcohol phosphatidyltransferase family protein [Pirellulaceae bacterium]|nr:CDP-alcohol phosphatidyltransferase family protein [Pirellulaceae bacterium]